MEPRSESVRFCGSCTRFVYRFENLRTDDIRELIEQTEGRLCAVLHRRRDGSLMTADCPRGRGQLRPRERGVALVAAITLALLWVATASPGLGQRIASTSPVEWVQQKLRAALAEPDGELGGVIDIAGYEDL